MKLKRVLMQMILEDHLKQKNKDLPKEEAEKLVYRWLDDEGNEWTSPLHIQ